MKAKIIFLVCLFMSMGVTQLSAQRPLPPNGNTGACSWYEEWDGYSVPVYIDGILVDVLSGTVNMHNVVRVQNGVYIGGTQHMYGEVVSEETGELFKVSDMSNFVYSDAVLKFRTMAIGNYGTRYILNFEYIYSTGEIIPVKTMIIGKPQ